jgi:hypothetical protein
VTKQVTITANGAQPLVLSGATASDQRISVQIKETTPGRVFQLAAVFPPGFQIPPGQEVHVSVKSNDVEHPIIVVPVIQGVRHPAMALPMAHPSNSSQSAPAAGHS